MNSNEAGLAQAAMIKLVMAGVERELSERGGKWTELQVNADATGVRVGHPGSDNYAVITVNLMGKLT